MNSLTISLLLPISGIVVTAVLVAVSRKKKQQQRDGKSPLVGCKGEIDMSWLDEYGEGKQQQPGSKKKGKAAGKKGSKKIVVKKNDTLVISNGKVVEEVESSSNNRSSNSSSESEDEIDDIQLLAALQKKNKSSIKKVIVPTMKPVSTPTMKPASAQIVVSEENIESLVIAVPSQPAEPLAEVVPVIEEEETAGWKAVPTKEELVLSSLRSRIESLGRSLEATEKSKMTAEKNLAVSQEKFARLEAELKERTLSSSLRQANLENELSSLKTHSQLLAKRLSQIEESDLAEAKEEISRLTSILLDAEARLASVSEERQGLIGHLGEKEGEISRLKETIESLQPFRSKCVGLESDLAKVQQAINSTESDLIALRSQEASRSAENKRLIEEKDQEIAQMKSSLSDATLHASRVEETLRNEMKAQELRLMDQKADWMARAGQFEASEAQYKARIAEVEASLRAAESEVALLKEKQAEMEAQLASVREEMIKADEKAKIEVASLGAQLEAKQSEADSLRTETESLRSETESLRNEAEGLRKDAESLRVEVENLRTQCDSLRSELDSNKVIAPAASEPTVPQSEFIALLSDLQSVKHHFAEHLTRTVGLKSRKEELEIENLRLETELNLMKAALLKDLQQKGGKKDGKRVPLISKAVPAVASVASSDEIVAPSPAETPLSR